MTGVPEAIAKVDAIPNALGAQIQAVMQAGQQQVLAIMDSLTPVRTGYLKSRNQVRDISSGFTIGFEAFNDADYAVFVVFGTSKMRARDFITPAMVFGRSYIISSLERIRL
jgi:HK97 gp10 family phage protein